MKPAIVVDARHVTLQGVATLFDGLSGEIDLEKELWGPVFEPLKNEAEFARLKADPEFETIVWPNGADLSPEFLHRQLTAALAGRRTAE